MANPALIALTDSSIFTGESFIEKKVLLLQGPQVLDIVAENLIPAEASRFSCKDHILAPGFIDAQVNGGGNILFNNAPSSESALKIAAAHKKYGTTRLVLTLMSDTFSTMQKALAAIRAARKTDSGILGIHFEGPHIVKRHNVHSAEILRDIGPEEMALYQPEENEVMLLTVAPERINPDQIKELCVRGIKISLGHTEAKPAQTRAALKAGASCFTHLFNGMGGISARGQEPAAVALDDRESWCDMIADGFHFTPEVMRLAVRAKPAGKVFVISDGMAPSATDTPLSFQLYGENIRIDENRCLTNQGVLAGAMITMADGLRYCVNEVGLELSEALRMVSTYPADFLGLNNKFGKLLPGFTADIVALDKDLKVRKVWFEGERA